MHSETMTSRLAPSFLPATTVLEMTYRCNHACLFCSCPWFAEGNGFEVRPEMGTEEWKQTILKLCGMGVTNLAFTGGEPLLKDDLHEIIRFAAGCTTEHIETKNGSLVSRFGPPYLYLLTNGLLLNDDVLAFCRDYWVHLGMSLPGLTTLREHTRSGDPDRILHGFTQAKKFGLNTHVGITVTRKNLHELYEAMGEALLAGAESVLLNRFLPGGRGIRYAGELSLGREELLQMLETAEEVLRLANRKGSIGTELPRCLVEESRYPHIQIGTRCSAAQDFFVIDPSGYIRVCNHSPVRLEHVSEIEKVKENPYWKRFVFKKYLPPVCEGCLEINRCDGGCREAAHIVGGSLDSPDPLLMPSGQ